MTVFTDGMSAGPTPAIDELGVPLSQQLGAAVSQTLATGPTAEVFGAASLASTDPERAAAGLVAEGQAERRRGGFIGPAALAAADPAMTARLVPPEGTPQIDMTAAKARVKQEGLEGTLTNLPQGPSMPQAALDIMIARAKAEREREATIARGPKGFIPSALTVGTSLLAGAADPLGLAAYSIPVLGEARFGKLMLAAGDNIVARAGVRAGTGAASGLAGSLALTPLEWATHTQEGRDYTMSEALHGMAFGAGLGGLLHAGPAAVGDVARSARGLPLKGREPVPGEEPTGSAGILPASAGAEESAGKMPAVPEGAAAPLPPETSTAAPSEPPVAESAAGQMDEYEQAKAVITQIPKGLGVLNPTLRRFLQDNMGIGRQEAQAHLDRMHDEGFLKGTRVVDTEAPIAAPIPASNPMEALQHDLPERAQEDVLRGAIAHITEDKPVQASAMLEAAAREDPRIAESMDAFDPSHGVEPDSLERAGPNGTITFPDEDHAALYDLGRKVEAGGMEKADLAEAERLLARFKGFVDVSDAPFGNARDVGEAALDYVRDVQGNFRSGRAPDVLAGDEARVAWLKRNEDERKGATVLPGPKAARGPRARDEDTWSLLQFLADRGGLKPDSELAAIFDKRNPFVPGWGKLIRATGMSLDRAREAATEARYIHDEGERTGGVSTSTISDLLEKIAEEHHGTRHYRAGGGPPETRQTGKARREEIGRTLDNELFNHGYPPIEDSARRARVIELIDKEGIADPLVAYERAVMEETQHGEDQGTAERIADHLPGWDVPDDAGAASAPGGAAPQEGQGAAGAGARGSRDADRAAAFDGIARTPSRGNEPGELAASRAADRLPEPASTAEDPAEAFAAAQRASEEAEAQWRDASEFMTDSERAEVEAFLKERELDNEADEQALRRAAACLIVAG